MKGGSSIKLNIIGKPRYCTAHSRTIPGLFLFQSENGGRTNCIRFLFIIPEKRRERLQIYKPFADIPQTRRPSSLIIIVKPPLVQGLAEKSPRTRPKGAGRLGTDLKKGGWLPAAIRLSRGGYEKEKFSLLLRRQKFAALAVPLFHVLAQSGFFQLGDELFVGLLSRIAEHAQAKRGLIFRHQRGDHRRRISSERRNRGSRTRVLPVCPPGRGPTPHQNLKW